MKKNEVLNRTWFCRS